MAIRIRPGDQTNYFKNKFQGFKPSLYLLVRLEKQRIYMKKLIFITTLLEVIVAAIVIFLVVNTYLDVQQIKIQTNEIICEALEMENG